MARDDEPQGPGEEEEEEEGIDGVTDDDDGVPADTDDDGNPLTTGASQDADAGAPHAPARAAGAAAGGAATDEEEDGEELVGEGMEADYRPMDRLDQYEEDGLDHAVYEDDVDARLAAEAALNARDEREVYGRQRGPRALLESSGDEDDAGFQRRRHQQAAEAAEGDGLGEEDGPDGAADAALDAFDATQMSLEEWIAQPNITATIKRFFFRFLQTYVPEGAESDGAGAGGARTNYYMEAVRHMCSNNLESLEVSYPHLSRAVPILAIWVADCPSAMLPILDEEAMRFALTYFPAYSSIHAEVRVRIVDLPIHDSIRDLRQVHLGCMVKVSGVVTRRTQVFPQLKLVKYDCPKCGNVLGPFVQRATTAEVRPGICTECQSKGPFTLNVEQTVYRNYQKITVQESPGTVPAGRLPRHKEVVLLADLIDCARPGEEVEVTGTYLNNYDALLNKRTGFPVFSTLIEANYVHKRSEDFAVHKLTDEETAEIRALARDPAVTQRVFESVAPSIYGHADIKRAVALSLFGGQAKDVQNKHRIRGDINVLMLGDPGTAKSQFLKYIEKTAPRAVYATGQGASAVGLTALVHRDPVTREWTLEGGALVLADRGVCLIDEFDKMNEQDRTSIHEAMEQQSISISKAGIVTSLQARCAVIAAANPVGGRYESTLSFADNVDLTEPILSRFDVTCILRDVANPVLDEKLAEFVLDSHARSHPLHVKAQAEEGRAGQREREAEAALRARNSPSGRAPISQDLLRKYIVYARTHCSPVLQDVDTDKIVKFYTELRRESHKSGGLVVAVRHLESLIRIAEVRVRACRGLRLPGVAPAACVRLLRVCACRELRLLAAAVRARAGWRERGAGRVGSGAGRVGRAWRRGPRARPPQRSRAAAPRPSSLPRPFLHAVPRSSPPHAAPRRRPRGCSCARTSATTTSTSPSRRCSPRSSPRRSSRSRSRSSASLRATSTYARTLTSSSSSSSAGAHPAARRGARRGGARGLGAAARAALRAHSAVFAVLTRAVRPPVRAARA